MAGDLGAARTFVATHARVIERRRLSALLGESIGSDGVVAALDSYRNADRGYGWALEPDHRSASGQPVAAMHALEALADVRDVMSDRPVAICDWLAEHALSDGGVPFGLPCSDTAGSAPHWTGANPSESSLQMTTQLAAQAHRLARLRADVAKHPWLAAASDYCLATLERGLELGPYELMFAMRFVDAASARGDRRADALLSDLVARVRTDGPTPVPGGAEGEVLHVLDFTPYADAPSRAAFDPTAIGSDLRRLASLQQADGGWVVDYTAFSPAAVLEWRGYATVQAVGVLRGIGL